MRTTYPTITSDAHLQHILKTTDELLSHAEGYNDITIFEPYRKRRYTSSGDGFFTDILGRLGKKALPILKKYILPMASQIGKNVFSDYREGKNIKESLKKRSLQSLGETVRKVGDAMGRRRRRSTVYKPRSSCGRTNSCRRSPKRRRMVKRLAKPFSVGGRRKSTKKNRKRLHRRRKSHHCRTTSCY